jgi:16S rRNA (cytidine1402-2'-O)-methyltransferase
MPGTLFVVATPIGNLEDITLRALRILREADLIAAEDTRRTAHLLARHAIATPTTSLHEHNEAGKSASLVARLVRGETIALVSDAGTPTVSDPGGRFIRSALDAGIRVEPIPGPSAILAALAVAGMPTERFGFLGFPPTRSKDRKKWLNDLANRHETTVFFEAPHRIRRTLEDLATICGDVEVFLGRELTKAHEESIKGPISAVLRNLLAPKGEFTVVVNIGQSTEFNPVGEGVVVLDYGQMIEKSPLSKAAILRSLAEKYRLSKNELYDLIERHKKEVV